MNLSAFDSVPITLHIEQEQRQEICVQHLRDTLRLRLQNRARNLFEDSHEVDDAYLVVLRDLLTADEFDALLAELEDMAP